MYHFHFYVLLSFILIFSGLVHVYQCNHTTTRSFSALKPLTAFTAISTPYISASFSTPNVYFACDNLTQSTIPHLSIFPYSCSGDIHLDTGPSLSHLLLCSLNTRSLLTSSHITAHNDLSDTYNRHSCYHCNLGPYHYYTCRTN